MSAKEEAERERIWRCHVGEHATALLRQALNNSNDRGIGVAEDRGGLTMQIEGPDGEWRRFYVRLTEVRQ